MRLKNRAFFLVLALAVAVGVLAPARPAPAYTSVSVSFFYDSLAPYGDWITVSNYGRCWRPAHVSAGWQPYLYGEWTYTDLGWTWVSFDPWGGDPYHYGTWVYTARYGWVWIPGTVWAPAWVTWCVTDDYFGWAPVPPSLVVGISGYAGPALTVSRSAYVFVPAQQFAGVNASTVRVPAAQNATFVARSRPVTRFAVHGGVLSTGGPAVSQVERASGRRVARVSVGNAKTQPVPVRASLAPGRSRASVVVPAVERARAAAPSGRHATQKVSRVQPYDARSDRLVRQQPAPPVRERERAVVSPPSPKHERSLQPPPAKHERSVQTAPPQLPKQRHEMTGAQARIEPGRGNGNAAVSPPPAPPARVERVPVAPPRAQGPPPQAHGNPPGQQKKEHGKED